MSKLGTVFRFVVARTYLWRLDPKFRGSNPTWMTMFLLGFAGELMVLVIILALGMVLPEKILLFDLPESQFFAYIVGMFLLFTILQYLLWVRPKKHEEYIGELRAMAPDVVERWTRNLVVGFFALLLLFLLFAFVAGRIVRR